MLTIMVPTVILKILQKATTKSVSLKKQPHKPDRMNFIGGSDARVIMGKDEKALHCLCQKKRGEVAPLDLSSVLIVQLGLATEDLNRRWYEQNSGHWIGDVQRRAVHRTIPDMAATLDGLVKETGAVFRSQVHAAVVVLGTDGGR
jgi:predicted phage-related endonuclease